MKRIIMLVLLCVGIVLSIVGNADVTYGDNDAVEKTNYFTVNDKRVDNKVVVENTTIKATSVCDDENVLVKIEVVAQTGRYHIPTDCGIIEYEGNEYKSPIELEEVVTINNKFDVMGVESIYHMYFKFDNSQNRNRQSIFVPIVR